MQNDSESSRVVADSMEHVVPAIDIDSTVSEADLERLRPDGDFVPVVSPHGRVLGLVSFDDLRAAVADGGGTASPKEVILLGVPLLRADASTADAIEQLRASRVDVLPVVDDERRLIGTISARQLALVDESDGPERPPEGFADCLEALERDAEAGLVPGELARWCEFVSTRLSELYLLWPARHRARFALIDDIRAQDPSLHARADELSRAEVAVGHRLETLCIAVREGARAPQPWREQVVRNVRSDLLHWIADVRAHDGDLTTWHNESLLRDRGVGD